MISSRIAGRWSLSDRLQSLPRDGMPVYYRPGSSDMILLYRILMKPQAKREYQIPAGISARVIFDIGANIGASALLFAKRFPNAILPIFEVDHADIIKIDTEVAEYDILTTFPKEWLAKASLILGEIHGHRDFELLAYLEQWFEVGVDRPLSSRLGHFSARRRG